jgi:hypothetical protein
MTAAEVLGLEEEQVLEVVGLVGAELEAGGAGRQGRSGNVDRRHGGFCGKKKKRTKGELSTAIGRETALG